MFYTVLPYAIASSVLAMPLLICFVLSIVGAWKIFTKAGLPGWKALIPGYNTYNLYSICWETKFFWIFFAAELVMGFLTEQASVILTLIYCVLGVISIVVDAKMNIRLAKAFGKGTGFGVLLWLLPFIGTLMLGFGDAEYIGSNE